jgi:hypothetical protein
VLSRGNADATERIYSAPVGVGPFHSFAATGPRRLGLGNNPWNAAPRQGMNIFKTDQQLARLRAHRSNIQRYRNILQTSLTELERNFVEKRLIEEQIKLKSLATSLPQ